MRYTALAILALLAARRPAFPQTVTVDEGSFTISRGGSRIGHENFTIRRTKGPSSDVYLANATVEYERQRLSPTLRTDTSYSPLAYQMEVRMNDEVQERLRGVIGRGRFSAQVKTPRGESTHEYIVSDGALVLDDDVYHQYYFLVQRARGGTATIPIVIPRRNTQQTVRVQLTGTDRVNVGGDPVEARHYTVTGSGGGAREVWTDAQGRVLEVRAGDITALRDERPH